MSIVRSLLISIGFVNDKKAINETNNAITGFKTRFALVATTAAYAFKVVKDFFTDIASATLDSEELAKSLGTSLNELTALQQAAQKFRIKPEQFSGALSILQKDLFDFKQGFGRLPELARQVGIEISRETNAIGLFDQILEKLRGIDDEQERIRVASNIFGRELGARFSNLSQNIDGFKESVKQAYVELESLPDITEDAKKYEDAVNGLGNAFDRLVRQLGKFVFPALEGLFNYLEILSRFYGSLFSGDFSGVKRVLNDASGLLDPLFEKTGLNKVSDFFKGLFGGNSLLNSIDQESINRLLKYVENREQTQQAPFTGYGNPFGGWASTVENKIDINMPQGTSGEQAIFLGNQIERMISDSINATFQEIQYNNPQVE